MAVEKETQLEAWLEENMPEPGGGNPNYVETIGGTVENPFGGTDLSELTTKLTLNEATVKMYVGNLQMFGQLWQGDILFSCCMFGQPTAPPVLAASVLYDETGSLLYAKSLVNSTWIDTPTTSETALIIVYHPLPEN